jgi:hypothetical protein
MALIIVSGAIANKLNQGGEAWVRLSYLLGLRRLGYRVHFVEQIAPATCVNSSGICVPFEESANRAYFHRVMGAFGLVDSATLIPTDQHGVASVPDHLFDLADAAMLLLNISGHLTIEPLLHRFRRKVFLDIDPGFTQFWHAMDTSKTHLNGHDDYFTIGENVEQPDCDIPSGGVRWRTTRPPVVLDEWPVTPAPRVIRFTTVANWRGPYGPVEIGGRTFGLKVHEFRKFLTLPSRTAAEFEIALNIHPADQKDRTALEENGWQVLDPLQAAATPEDFRRYIQRSAAEFSVAQGMYVQSKSGWFSDRTTRYLASGRPALVQETGFSKHLLSRQGLVSFNSLDEAVEKVAAIVSDYPSHARAARAVAEAHFDSDVVLNRLIGALRETE